MGREVGFREEIQTKIERGAIGEKGIIHMPKNP